MNTVVYEFPLNERVRNYLRIEQLMARIHATTSVDDPQVHLLFFEHLFTLLDMIERIDIRSDVVKELDTQEKNLVHWAQHPNIDDSVLQQTLAQVIRIRDDLKAGKKPGTSLREDNFLNAIRQRFAIPGGTCSFDLPNLHFWLNTSIEQRKQAFSQWLKHLALLEAGIALLLSFLRERGNFSHQTASNGFFQGDAEDKSDLIRVRLPQDSEVYPTLSGNKYRFALRFMRQTAAQSTPEESDISFELSSCS